MKTVKLTQQIVFGKADVMMRSLELFPDSAIRPAYVTCNVPFVGLVFVYDVKVANVGIVLGPRKIPIYSVSVQTGSYVRDAYAWREKARIYCPEVLVGNNLCILASYNGVVPDGFKSGDTFNLEFSFECEEPSDRLPTDSDRLPTTENREPS